MPLHCDDVLVLDEASQLATADLALIGEAARQAGARIIATGDTAQLGAVEAAGMFRLLAREVPAAELHEVRRFDAQWERQASIRLRSGDPAAVAAYDRHGRIRGADYEAAYDRAASMWLADYLRGKDVLLLAGSNAEAADLARRVQAKLTQLGTIGPPQAVLSDGNHAGIGDLIRARLNITIDADGRPLTNRDILQIAAFRGPPPKSGGSGSTGPGPRRSASPGPTWRPAPSSLMPATSTSPRAGPSTPPTYWSPSRCPGRPCMSA